MRINHNISALNTYRQLSANTGAGAKSLEKLSSGLRINRAGDDAAGLAISEKMRGQIRGLDQATRNAQDGISLIQTTEGALNETHSILQRMRELAVQSANDTNTASDRSELQKEVDQLAKEVTRIGNSTEFNTRNLLDGTFKGTLQIGANAGQNVSLDVGDMRAFELGIVGDVSTVEAGTVSNLNASFTVGSELTVQEDAGTPGNYNLLDSNGSTVASSTDGGITYVATADVADTITFTDAVTSGKVTVDSGILATGEAVVTNSGLEAGSYTYDLGTTSLLDSNGKVVGNDKTTAGTFVDNEGIALFTVTDALADGSAIEVTGIDISNQTAADAAITKINTAVESVSTERSKLGAFQNRLEHTINNLGTSSENLTGAESRIRDVDMAKEMMEFTKNNILTQAATAMLAQANQQPQGVLQLLN